MAATATEAANGDSSQVTDTIDVEVNAVADQPSLTVPSTITFDEDTISASFAIASSLGDTDGSESLTITVSDIPEGVTLSDGIRTFVGTAGNTTVNVTDWSLSNLTLIAPADSDVDFDLQVTAVATEAANGDIATSRDVISIEVDAIADEPTLIVPSTVRADSVLGSAEFVITADLNDTDGSETLTVVVGDLPVGTTLSDGVNTFTARNRTTDVEITDWSLDTLTITPAAELTEDFTVTVVASAVEQENGDTFSTLDAIVVEVEAVADEPKLTVPSTIRVDEDLQSSPFTITADLVDADGSEFLTVTISDIPMGTQLSDGTHNFTASVGASSVEIVDWDLSQLTVTAPPHSDVDFDLTVTATATENMNADTIERQDTISVRVKAVADQPTLTVPSTVTVNEDSQSAAFEVSSSLIDTDGSESLSIQIRDIPKHVTISDGTQSFTSGVRLGKVDVTGWDLTQLTVTPPTNSEQDFTLRVTATATEADNGDRASKHDEILVQVNSIADQPVLIVPSTVAVDEDTRSAVFGINAMLTDTDGSESLSLVIADLPVGATLTDGRNEFVGSVGNTTVDISDWNANRLRVTPPADSDLDFTLTVTATAVEGTSGDAVAIVDSFDIQVTAVADQPLLSVPTDLTIAEDAAASFSIGAGLQDLDGSETLALSIGNVPVGATLSDGTHTFTAADGNGTVDVTTWDLANLQIAAPAQSDADFDLVVTVTATEGANADQALATETIKVQITAEADPPVLSAPTVITVNEDMQSGVFAVAGTLVDTDGSELIQVSVTDIPVGVTISDGSKSFTATANTTHVGITGWKLDNLSVTPPTNSDQDFALTIEATATESTAAQSR